MWGEKWRHSCKNLEGGTYRYWPSLIWKEVEFLFPSSFFCLLPFPVIPQSHYKINKHLFKEQLPSRCCQMFWQGFRSFFNTIEFLSVAGVCAFLTRSRSFPGARKRWCQPPHTWLFCRFWDSASLAEMPLLLLLSPSIISKGLFPRWPCEQPS